MRWGTCWLVIKDVLLTGLGVVTIWSQIRSAHPDGLLIGAGLALTVPSVAEHVRALLPGPGASPTLPSSPSSGEQASPPSPGGQSGE